MGGMNEDLAEGTNAPIGDDSSIPLKVSENIEDFKITTELIKEATGDLSEDLTEKTVNAVTTAPNKSKVSPGTEGKQNPKSRSIGGNAKNLASHKNRHLVNNKTCGRPSNFKSKIVGGEDATIEEFPWLALLAVMTKAWDGKSLVVAGWGKVKQDAMGIEDDVIANDLQKLEVKRVSNQKCRAVHGDSKEIAITEPSQNLCAGGEEGKDSCAGDSGGPLMLTQDRMGRKNHTLVGLVSWGPKFCGQKNLPGIYADVSFFLEWILNTID